MEIDQLPALPTKRSLVPTFKEILDPLKISLLTKYTQPKDQAQIRACNDIASICGDTIVTSEDDSSQQTILLNMGLALDGAEREEVFQRRLHHLSPVISFLRAEHRLSLANKIFWRSGFFSMLDQHQSRDREICAQFLSEVEEQDYPSDDLQETATDFLKRVGALQQMMQLHTAITLGNVQPEHSTLVIFRQEEDENE